MSSRSRIRRRIAKSWRSGRGPLLTPGDRFQAACNGRPALRRGRGLCGPGARPAAPRPEGRGALRCSPEQGGCDPAAAPLHAAPPHGFSPVWRLCARRPRPGLQARPAPEASKSAQALLLVHTRPLLVLRCSSPQFAPGPHNPRPRLRVEHRARSSTSVQRRCGASRQVVPGGGDFGGDEKRSAGVGARSAHPELTRRVCSNAANAVSAVSYAARPQGEHRSAVGAFGRPPTHEPLPGTACRAALTTIQSRRPPKSAPGRLRSVARHDHLAPAASCHSPWGR